jgi:hypothetical protein
VFLPGTVWAHSLPYSPYQGASGLVDSETFLSYFLCRGSHLEDALRYKRAFLRGYAEWVHTVVRGAADLLRVAVDRQRFRDDGADPEKRFLGDNGRRWSWTWAQKLEADIHASGVVLRLHFADGASHLDYGFRSLAGALSIMFVMDTTVTTTPVRLCALQPECGRPFIGRNERARYCSESHSNVDRQRRWQRGQNKKNNKRGRNGPRRKK